jgi:chromosome segregation ATPase
MPTVYFSNKNNLEIQGLENGFVRSTNGLLSGIDKIDTSNLTSTLQSRLNTIESNISNLDNISLGISDISGLQSQLTDINNHIISETSNITEIQGQITSHASDITSLQSQLSDIDTYITADISTNTSLESQLSTNTSSITVLQSQINAIPQELKTVQPTIASIGSTYFDIDTNTLYVYNGTAWKSIALV